MDFTGDDHELEHGDIDGHDGKGPGAEEGAAATAGETTEVSLVPRSTSAQSKSSKKVKKRKGFKPQKVKPKKPSSSNKTNKLPSSKTDEVPVSTDVEGSEVEADAGKLKPPPPASATEGSNLQTRKDDARGVGSDDKEKEAGRQPQEPQAQEGKGESISQPLEDDGEREESAGEQNGSSIVPTASSMTLQRRQRSDSVASTATTSSRKRTASTIRVGASRGAGGRNKSGGVRFRPLPSSAAFRQGGETGAANEIAEPSRALVPIEEAGATSKPAEQQETLGEDAPPTPSSTALVAAAEAAHTAGDQATLHDRELLEKLALESADQPRLGMFCSQFKRPKRKKEDEGTSTKKKRRKKRKKKHDDDNNTQQPTENNENRDPATAGTANQNSTGAAGATTVLRGGNSSDRDNTSAAGTGDANNDSQPSGRDGDGDAQAPLPAPAGIPAVHVVDGQIVLQESSLVLPVRRTIKEVEEEFHDNVVEEDAQPAIVNASYSSFRTKRGATETVKKGPSIWSAKETYEFLQALRMLGTDFGAMEAMFDGRRTRRQLKLKYKCELGRNPSLVEKLTDPRFKEPLDMSKFEISADQGLIENSNRLDHEHTDTAAAAGDGDGDIVNQDSETAPSATGQEKAPTFQPEELGGDYLEVVEEDAEEERLASIEKSKRGEELGGAATSKAAPSESTGATAKKPKATKKRAARKPVARKTRKTKPATKEKEKNATETGTTSSEVTGMDSSKQAARKPVARKTRKSKPVAEEKEKSATGLAETESSPGENPTSETVQNDIGHELEDSVSDDLLEGYFDMPMGDEEEQAKASSEIKSKKNAQNSRKKAAAADSAESASSKNVSAPTNKTPNPVGKAEVIRKKSSVKSKRRRPRPLPVKKM